jgi:hypothetical protein
LLYSYTLYIFRISLPIRLSIDAADFDIQWMNGLAEIS